MSDVPGSDCRFGNGRGRGRGGVPDEGSSGLHHGSRRWRRPKTGCPIPAIAVDPSRARSSMLRKIVGSDATFPNRCERARSIATSAGQSPPAASITARSLTALPGRWTADGSMNPPSPPSSASTRRRARAVSVGSSVYAPDTEPDESDRYLTFGHDLRTIILEVLLPAGLLTCRKANNPRNSRRSHYFRRLSRNILTKWSGQFLRV
jgi:hypothetical protein